MQHFDNEATLGAVTQFHPAPCRFRLVLCPFSNLDRVALRYCFAWMPTPVSFTLGYPRLRILQVNALVAVHIRNKDLVVIVQRPQQSGCVSVQGVFVQDFGR